MAGNDKVEVVISATDKTGPAIALVNAGLSRLGDAATRIGPALGGALSGAALTSFVKSAIQAGDELYDLSQKTGVAVERLSAYRLAADQSGTSLEAVAKGMARLSKELVANGESFQRLGVDTGNLDTAMADIAELFSTLPDGVEKSALAVQLFGKAGADLIPLLNLGRDGLDQSAEASARYGSAMAELAPQADKFNDALAEISLNSKAGAAEIAGALIPTMQVLADEFLRASKESGTLKSAGESLNVVLQTISVLGVNVAYVFKSIGTEIGGLAAQATALASLDFRGFTAIGAEMRADAASARAEVDALSEKLLGLGKPAESAAGSVKKTGDAAADASKRVKDFLKSIGGAAAAAKKPVDELAAVLNKINSKDSGLDASYWKDLQTLFSGYQAGRLSIDAYRESVEKLTNQQKFATDAVAKAKKEEEDWAKAVEKAREDVDRNITSLEEKAAALEDEYRNYGKTRAEIENTIIARLEEQRAIAAGFDSQEELVANLEREISARERARDAMRGIDAADAAKKAAEDSAKEWEKFSEQVEQSLTDALMRSFEAGDSFGKAFAKNLENTFKTMVLKFAVQMVVGTGGSVVASVADAALGTSFSKSGGGSGSSLISGASNLSTAYSWGSTAADLAFGSSSGSLIPWLTGASAVAPSSVIAANAVGAAGGDAIGALIAAEGWSSATAAGASAAAVGAEAGAAAAAAGAESAAAGAAAGAAAAEGAGMTAASAIPYVGWAIAAIAAIAALGGSGPKEYTGATALEGAYAGQGDFYGWSGADWKRDGGWFSSDSKGTKFNLVGASTEAFFESLYANTAKGFIDLGKSLGDTSVEELLKGFSTTISARSEFGAFFEIAQQVSDQLTTGMAKLVMPAVGDIMSRTGNTDVRQAMTIALSQVQAVRHLLDLIGKTANTGVNDTTLAHMTSVADRVVLLFGGIDNLNSAVGTYYQNFFSAAEQSAKAREAVNASLTALNLPLVETKDQFRALVDSLNLGEVAGQNTFKALMDLAPAFAAVADAASAAQAKILEDRQAWQNKLDVLTGATTERQLQLQADLASTTDATTQALIRQVYAQEDLNASAAAAAERAAAAAERAAAIASERIGLENQLLQAQGNTAAIRAAELAALDESNRALQEQIWLTQDQAAVASERIGLENQLLQAQGNTAAIRAAELAALDESNRALQEQIWAVQDAAEAARLAAAAAEEQARADESARQAAEQAAQQAAQAAAAIANERIGLQKQLWQLEGNTVDLRAAELAALDASNRALQEQIWALEDQAAAAQEAARVESERLGLQKQMWQIQGNTNALRAAELAALDPANRALQQQIWALEDSKKAADEWKQTWDSVTASLIAQAKKIRGEISGALSASSLQAQFVTTTAAARAGDAKAAGNLVGLSGDLLAAFRNQAGSQIEMQRMQAWVATSLEETANVIGVQSPDAQAADEVRSLRADQQAQAEAMTRLLARMDKLYARWDRDGLPATRVED